MSHDTRDIRVYTVLIDGKRYRYIKVADGDFVKAKTIGEVQIKMRDYNG